MNNSTRRGRSTSTPVSCPRFARQWSEVLAELRASVGEEQFDTWFGSIRGVRLCGSVLELELPNGHYARWIEENFFEQLEAVVHGVLGPDVNIVLKASESSSEREQLDPAPISESADERPEELSEVQRPYSMLYHHWVDKLVPEVGLSAWGVYLVLLRFVWRRPTRFDALQEHIERGALVAHVSKDKLARISGLSVRTVQYCLRELERISLIRVMPCSGHANLYMLGRKSPKGECWFADLVCKDL